MWAKIKIGPYKPWCGEDEKVGMSLPLSSACDGIAPMLTARSSGA